MSNEHKISELEQKVAELNAVSPTMCLAKWKQSTTTLYNGMTHSCHHPIQHKINVEDIKNNPRGLHNTPIKIVARQDMLKGIQTKECDYCWNIENLKQSHFSDRHYKSANDTWESFQEVIASGDGVNIDPSYLEVAFDSTCNFKCSYCSPDVSSRWMEEIVQHGPMKLYNKGHHNLEWVIEQGRLPIHHKSVNPYIDAFWKWWPDLYKNLKTFRITGGEPLLSKHTWSVIDHMINEPRADLNFSVNTNMGVPEKLVTKLIEKVNILDKKIGSVIVFTSAESTGPQAEYSRYGMIWDEFKSNCERFLVETSPDVRLHFMTTVNVFSISTFDLFIRWMCELRVRFNKNRAHNRIGFSVSYLRWPNFLSLTQLDVEQKQAFRQKMQTLIDESEIINKFDTSDQNTMGKLYLEEVDMLRRLCDFVDSHEQEKAEVKNFQKFVDEYDSRRGTDFKKTFPELTTMYKNGND